MACCYCQNSGYLSMGESTSVFIRRFIKLKCAYGDLCILTISRIKRIKKYIFVLISFRNLDRSIHPTTCRSMFSDCQKWWKLLWIGGILFSNCSGLYTSEKSRAVRKKCRVCQRAMSFLSLLTEMWERKRNWKWIQEVDVDRVPFQRWCRKFDKPRVATKKPMKRRKELGSEVDIRSFFKKPRINWYP